MSRPVLWIVAALSFFLAIAAYAPRNTSRSLEAPSAPPNDQLSSFLEGTIRSARFTRGLPNHLAFTDDGTLYFLRGAAPDWSQKLWRVRPGEAEQLAFDPAQYGTLDETAMTAEERALRERLRTSASGITDFQIEGDEVLIPVGGQLVHLDAGQTNLLNLGRTSAFGAQISPTLDRLIYLESQVPWVHSLQDHSERALLDGPLETGITLGHAEFVAQEEMDRTEGFWWAPDGRHVVVQRTDENAVETLFIADPAHPEAEPMAMRYPRATRTNAAVTLLWVDAATGQAENLAWDISAFPYLVSVRFHPNGHPLALVEDRTQTEVQLLELAPGRAATVLWADQDPAWINIDQSTPIAFDQGLVVTSESTGIRRIAHHSFDGTHEWISPSNIEVSEVVKLELSGGRIWFIGAPNPRERHLYRVNLNGQRLEDLSAPGDWVESAAVADLRGEIRYAVSTRRLDAEPRVTLTSGDAVQPIGVRNERAPFTPQVESFELGPDGYQAGVAIPEGRGPFPILHYVYGGPGVQLVTNDQSRLMYVEYLRRRGFAVFFADTHGTPGRGRDFERATYQDFVTQPVSEQMQALVWLRQRHPELPLDYERVGAFGWSFGGTLSLAMFLSSNAIRCAAPGAPVTDWLNYDTHYTERYLGVSSSSYARPYFMNSPSAWVRDPSHALRQFGPQELLLFHGTADDNVFFFQTLEFADALFERGRRAAVVPISGSTHRVAEPERAVAIYDHMVEFFSRCLRR